MELSSAVDVRVNQSTEPFELGGAKRLGLVGVRWRALTRIGRHPAEYRSLVRLSFDRPAGASRSWGIDRAPSLFLPRGCAPTPVSIGSQGWLQNHSVRSTGRSTQHHGMWSASRRAGR